MIKQQNSMIKPDTQQQEEKHKYECLLDDAQSFNIPQTKFVPIKKENRQKEFNKQIATSKLENQIHYNTHADIKTISERKLIDLNEIKRSVSVDKNYTYYKDSYEKILKNSEFDIQKIQLGDNIFQQKSVPNKKRKQSNNIQSSFYQTSQKPQNNSNKKSFVLQPEYQNDQDINIYIQDFNNLTSQDQEFKLPVYRRKSLVIEKYQTLTSLQKRFQHLPTVIQQHRKNKALEVLKQKEEQNKKNIQEQKSAKKVLNSQNSQNSNQNYNRNNLNPNQYNQPRKSNLSHNNSQQNSQFSYQRKSFQQQEHQQSQSGKFNQQQSLLNDSKSSGARLSFQSIQTPDEQVETLDEPIIPDMDKSQNINNNMENSNNIQKNNFLKKKSFQVPNYSNYNNIVNKTPISKKLGKKNQNTPKINNRKSNSYNSQNIVLLLTKQYDNSSPIRKTNYQIQPVSQTLKTINPSTAKSQYRSDIQSFNTLINTFNNLDPQTNKQKNFNQSSQTLGRKKATTETLKNFHDRKCISKSSKDLRIHDKSVLIQQSQMQNEIKSNIETKKLKNLLLDNQEYKSQIFIQKTSQQSNKIREVQQQHDMYYPGIGKKVKAYPLNRQEESQNNNNLRQQRRKNNSMNAKQFNQTYQEGFASYFTSNNTSKMHQNLTQSQNLQQFKKDNKNSNNSNTPHNSKQFQLFHKKNQSQNWDQPQRTQVPLKLSKLNQKYSQKQVNLNGYQSKKGEIKSDNYLNNGEITPQVQRYTIASGSQLYRNQSTSNMSAKRKLR